MELAQQKKLAGHILRLLKVSYIDFPLGRTNKGNLAIRFDDSGDFTLFLDSVPLPTKDSLQNENNIELKRMLEKYWFENVVPKYAASGTIDLKKMVSPYPEVETQKERLMRQVEESGIAKDSIIKEILPPEKKH